MIVRILGEGQLTVADGEVDELNRLDDALTGSLDSGDEGAFRAALAALLARVREVGTALDESEIVPSDAVLPAEDATAEDVRALLTDEGVIPG
ncbi:hypothetical protein CLV35_2526 [Motilibacter peucedani]|uniref:PspA-associated domain-containing protein n=1 Tax=Motilibacter peucedani TaxID=598650 RepID=A0A420XPA7_9ACTN|nr:hypothetical protein [Motilibacter peucedani]RKS74028.1 hypothetical protein CLV35_2526 [Motilibacter peucedani]